MTIRRCRRAGHAAACVSILVCHLCAGSADAQILPSTAIAAVTALADFDDAKRIGAAKALRRMPADEAATALLDAVVGAKDEYVRFRAFVLLTGFNHPRMTDVVRTVMRDRNDRLREGAYAWLERNPDPGMTDALLNALETEQGEFVRPALVRAVAALDASDRVRAALVREVGRGLDIFRSAVITALGDRRAAYAVDAIAEAAALDGPLQDDAVAALGKIGGEKALKSLASLTTTNDALKVRIATARCLANGDCASQREQLVRELETPLAAAAVSSLALLAHNGDVAALNLLSVSARTSKTVRDEAAIAMASVALKRPQRLLEWLALQPADRDAVLAVLHDAFERLEADLDEEAFFAAVRSAYWRADEGSASRAVAAALIDKLEF